MIILSNGASPGKPLLPSSSITKTFFTPAFFKFSLAKLTSSGTISEEITLPSMTTTTGTHTFNVMASMPNGVPDDGPGNDSIAKISR